MCRYCILLIWAGEGFETDPETAVEPAPEARSRCHEPGEVGRVQQTDHRACCTRYPDSMGGLIF